MAARIRIPLRERRPNYLAMQRTLMNNSSSSSQADFQCVKERGRRRRNEEVMWRNQVQASRDTRLITGCGPTPESVRRSGPKRLKTLRSLCWSSALPEFYILVIYRVTIVLYTITYLYTITITRVIQLVFAILLL